MKHTTDYTVIEQGDIEMHRASSPLGEDLPDIGDRPTAELSFELPDQLERHARSVLAFFMRAHADDRAEIDVNVNGKTQLAFQVGQPDIFGGFHCVVAGGVLNVGENTLQFTSRALRSVGGTRAYSCTVGQIVLWWQNQDDA